MTEQNPNTLLSIEVNLTLTIILSICALLLLGVYFECGEQAHQTIIFALLLIGGVCQISLAYYALKNLQLATEAQNQSFIRLRKQEELAEQQRKADKASSFASRWNETAMFHSRKIARKITTLNDPVHVLTWLNSDENLTIEDKENCARHILNFLEEMSTAIHEGHCAEEYVHRLFKGVVINIWSAMKLWIDAERLRKHRPTIFIETENLYNRWKVGID
ncbi:MAG: DUF4760 domain-containing protein [Acetobacter syzygii]|uniref:DUF4760 domain-containing protein n=1 Tax=Acetobacter syzygii TaxID=146476 RepID=UPI0039E907EC